MKRTHAYFLAAILSCLAGCTVAHGTKAEIPAAVEYIENRLGAFDRVLYVYKDASDGANRFTQKAWIGSDYRHVPPMLEDAAGQDSSTGIFCELNLQAHTWGGYMFVTGSLQAGSSVPEVDFSKTDTGLNLAGAEKLTFCAKGENGGERVEFFMGGYGHNGLLAARYADSTPKVTLGYVTLTKDWTRYEISLVDARLDRVSCGFGWVTNDVHNPGVKSVRFYLDNIRYEFAQARIKPVFLTSYAPASPGTDGAVINNFAYLYDQCAAALALSYAGHQERARQIADAIVYALDHDRYYTDGRLRNAYMGGEPQSDPGWLSARGEAFARMPGFCEKEAGMWYEDVYAVSAGSAGNMAWAILALCEVYENAGENAEYLRAARQIGDFVLTLQTDNGFTGGYEGWEGNETKATYLSTEHNTDLISAFGRLHKLTGEQKYADAAALAKAFVLSMYDAEKGCFYTGTTGDGVTANKDVIPLDCQTWTLLALGDAFEDGARMLRFIEENMAVNGGYDFNTDRDGVWYEGTAQVALAYLSAGDEVKYHEILETLNAGRQPDGSITAADRAGVSTGFTVSGLDIPWEYDARVHLGATAWLALAQMGRNPFAY